MHGFIEMIKQLAILLAIFSVSFVAIAGDVYVSGHYRSNGTYVKSHYRSAPDGNFDNNWSTLGNVNPYTGKLGTLTKPGVRTKKQYFATTLAPIKSSVQLITKPKKMVALSTKRLVLLAPEKLVAAQQDIISKPIRQTILEPEIPKTLESTTKPRMPKISYSAMNREAQLYLNYLGFNVGIVDGLLGNRTRAAISAYQRLRDMTVTGEVDEVMLDKMSLEIGAKSRSGGGSIKLITPASIKVLPPLDLVAKTQFYLNGLGLYSGRNDGTQNIELEQAIMRFQNSNRISVDGRISAGLLIAIKKKIISHEYVATSTPNITVQRRVALSAQP